LKEKVMSYKILEGKKGIVFCALDKNSIAWKTAEAIVASGGLSIGINPG
jgi:enoyl-[acyl-carrier protein] reductase I